MRIAMPALLLAAMTMTCLLAFAGAYRWRRRRREALLRRRSIRLAAALLLPEGTSAPGIPRVRGAAMRRVLTEVLAACVATAVDIDERALRRIVAENGLDIRLLRTVRFTRGYRRAYALSLLAAFPLARATARRTERYLRSRHPQVAFQALLVQLAAAPGEAQRRLCEFPRPFTDCEIAELELLARRGALRLCPAELLRSRSRNLRRFGLGLVRHFGIDRAESDLRRIAAEDPDLGCDAVATLCALHRPLAGAGIERRIATADAFRRRSLLRRMAREGYAARTLHGALAEADRQYYESLIRSYKRCLG